MTTPITPRDWEFLSAYLDGELKDKEKKLLEDRVREDDKLRLSLESLQHVRAVLRSQPIQRAPRNFTLTPVMAGMDKGRSQAAPVFRVMRLASVLATIFLVVISVGNLLANRMQPVQVSQTFAQQPAFGMGGGGGGGGGSESEESLSVPEALQVEEQITSEVSDMAADVLQVEPLPAGTESELKAAVPNPTPTPQPPVESLRKAPEAGQPLEAESDEIDGAQTKASTITLIGGLQIILAILAITTGVLAVYLRQSTR